MKKVRPKNPVDFDRFNPVSFYRKYQNQQRIYLFDMLFEFNQISKQSNTNGEESICVSFDTLTKIGLICDSIKNHLGDHHLDGERMIDVIRYIVTKPNIGVSFSPIFQYKGKLYTKGQHNYFEECYINLRQNTNTLKELENKFSKHHEIIISGIEYSTIKHAILFQYFVISN